MNPAKSGDPRRLLQIVRDNDDGMVALQIVDGLFDFRRRDRIDRRAGLVKQPPWRRRPQGLPAVAKPLPLPARVTMATWPSNCEEESVTAIAVVQAAST